MKMVTRFTTVKEAIIIIVIAAALAGAGYGLRPVILTLGTAKSTGGGPTGGDPTGGGDTITAISLEDARGYFETGAALFADARPKAAYADGHIKGAVNLNPNQFDTWSGDFFSNVPQDRTIITYCEGAQCRLSFELAEKLSWMGYEAVFYIKDGWGLWKKHQLPIERLSH
jgi:rhodanese-related sulfurtransferase